MNKPVRRKENRETVSRFSKPNVKLKERDIDSFNPFDSITKEDLLIGIKNIKEN